MTEPCTHTEELPTIDQYGEPDGGTVTSSAWVETSTMGDPDRRFLCSQCGTERTEPYQDEEWVW